MVARSIRKKTIKKRRSSQGRTADVVVPPLFTTAQIAQLAIVFCAG
jgi:hypothetical protein